MTIKFTITPPREGINFDLLDEQLKASFSDVLGISKMAGEWIVHLSNSSAVTHEQIQSIVNNHDVTMMTDLQKIDQLKDITRNDAILYFRNQLLEAAGDSSILEDLYAQARAYEQGNQMLTDTMLTLRTIRETSLDIPIVLTTNQGKAQYLEIFLTALALWS